jgi:predicted Zn-ribbon and HTH transcriptional regulator
MLSEWNIEKEQVHCLIRDEGSNMKRAVRLVGLNDKDYTIDKIHAIRSCLGSQENIKIVKEKCKKNFHSFQSFYHRSETTANNSGQTEPTSS